MLISLVLLLMILCFSKSGEPISKSRSLTDVLRFVFALIVVNGHIWQFYMSESWWQGQFMLGAECVSVFLFLSAYGLMNAYDKKGSDYLHGFAKHRIGRVVLPLLTTYVVSSPVYAIFKEQIEWREVCETLYWGGPYIRFSWYVSEIVVLYLLFYVCAKADTYRNKNGNLLLVSLSCVVLILAIVLFLSKLPVWYINGLPCFILGLWYQRHEAKIIRFLHGWRGKGIGVLVVALFAILFQWSDVVSCLGVMKRYLYEYVSLYLVNLMFVLTIAYVIGHTLSYKNTPPYIESVISTSYEIYLIQNACMIACDAIIPSRGLFIFCTLVMSILMGWVMNQVNSKIQKYIL